MTRDFAEKLREMEACDEAIQWAGDMTFNEAWNKCSKPNWMLWLLTATFGHAAAIRMCINIAGEFAREDRDTIDLIRSLQARPLDDTSRQRLLRSVFDDSDLHSVTQSSAGYAILSLAGPSFSAFESLGSPACDLIRLYFPAGMVSRKLWAD